MAILYQHKIRERLHLIEKRTKRPFISWTEELNDVDPVYFFSLGPICSFRERFFWGDRTNETVYVGLGCTYVIETEEKEERFHTVETQWKQWVEQTDHYSNGIKMGPILFGGFSFDPYKPHTEKWRAFPHAKMLVPAVLLASKGGKATLTVTVRSGQSEETMEKIETLFRLLHEGRAPIHSLPSVRKYEEKQTEQWFDAVKQTIANIHSGKFDKVVLAREARLSFADRVEASVVLRQLREQQPFSYLFAFEQEGQCFIGASPEQLVKKEGDACYSTCLAGSIRRGKTVQEDEQLGEWLLHDEKNLHEHHFVVQMIKEAMEAVCERVYMPPSPQLLKLPNIQHLYTPVIGEHCRASSILSMVAKMHPTPALGGTPREAAVKEIREVEPLDRGWYAGPIGWMDTEGNGEFAVAIRSGLLQGQEVSIFAGCGIVGDSDPISEYEETKVKFIPMLSALGVGQDE
ncbi:isochorismate synthase [Saccharococcus caldoxylosilyticus]|uniref:Isochorismate synthase MenF n=1 Tax=Saccharococcus caldoxylosilyticus TaxID=81408 RepID=A0A150M589_9BACL|nr:isochorismate synthase [Parageobacillus caldoxylosilyticus]OQP03375.1 isochorismate synthase [Geobacillus sp. 44B]KYD19774.1 Isochorismate synthase [Parageobacillus caldoxylosilyticus]QNU39246.1 isochorismate synthase [Geobacillus sp. 44B]BDG37216.1 isochorismate synthase MenF [Parageobacillus caldoxylosilyticus]BDG41007.1 isochorismate synthase MenF [Parageobacillus caldoxylosilyticus]